MKQLVGYTAILDGYNVIKRHPQWKHLPLERGRQRLAGFLAGYRWPLPVARIVVVFDSQAPQGGDYVAGAVTVRFASPSADAAIQALLRTDPQPRHLLIISDDREILDTARAHGACCQSSAWLWQARPGAAKAAGAPEGKADLPAAHARAITEEMARRWLRPPRPPAKP